MLENLLYNIQNYQKECMPDAKNLRTVMRHWASDGGFSSKIWMTLDEFLNTQFMDKDYMKDLLSERKYKEYEKWMQSIPNLHTVKLTFIDDDLEPDTGEFVIKTPGSVSSENVKKKLCKSYDKLIEKLPNGPFAKTGYTPETLVKHVCGKNEWAMQRIDFDITLEIGP